MYRFLSSAELSIRRRAARAVLAAASTYLVVCSAAAQIAGPGSPFPGSQPPTSAPDARGVRRADLADATKSPEAAAFHALVAYPSASAIDEAGRAAELASAGVPAARRSLESVRHAAKQYARDRWKQIRSEREEASNKTTAEELLPAWIRLASDERRLFQDAIVRAGLELRDVRPPAKAGKRFADELAREPGSDLSAAQMVMVRTLLAGADDGTA